MIAGEQLHIAHAEAAALGLSLEPLEDMLCDALKGFLVAEGCGSLDQFNAKLRGQLQLLHSGQLGDSSQRHSLAAACVNLLDTEWSDHSPDTVDAVAAVRAFAT